MRFRRRGARLTSHVPPPRNANRHVGAAASPGAAGRRGGGTHLGVPAAAAACGGASRCVGSRLVHASFSLQLSTWQNVRGPPQPSWGPASPLVGSPQRARVHGNDVRRMAKCVPQLVALARCLGLERVLSPQPQRSTRSPSRPCTSKLRRSIDVYRRLPVNGDGDSTSAVGRPQQTLRGPACPRRPGGSSRRVHDYITTHKGFAARPAPLLALQEPRPSRHDLPRDPRPAAHKPPHQPFEKRDRTEARGTL